VTGVSKFQKVCATSYMDDRKVFFSYKSLSFIEIMSFIGFVVIKPHNQLFLKKKIVLHNHHKKL